jgi:O-antigen/teichoic acid export membrane protein
MNGENGKPETTSQATSGQQTTQEKADTDKQSETKSLLIRGLYAILFLIIFLAVFQLYFSAQEFISRWFSYDYIPVVNSLYYLAIIVVGIFLILSYVRSR